MRKSMFVATVVWLFSQPTINVSAAEGDISWSSSTGVSSEYLAQIGATLSKSPISVNIIEADYKNFYLGIWNATSLGGRKYGSTYGDEWDLYGGWSHMFGPMKLDLSGSYFALYELDKTRDDMWITDQILSLPKMPFVEPYIKSRYFGSVGSFWKPGWFGFIGLRKSIPFGHGLAGRPYTLNIDASTAYDFGALTDYKGFVYYRFTTGLDIPLSKRATLAPYLLYQLSAPGEKFNPKGFTHGDKFVYGVTLKWVF